MSIVYPHFQKNTAKTPPFGAAHTYMAYVGQYPPTQELGSECSPEMQ